MRSWLSILHSRRDAKNRRQCREWGNRRGSRVARLETLETRTVLSSVSGVSFNDVNGNGLRDAGEEVLADTAVYLDQNNSGTLDPGEQSTTTDGNGEYVFDSLSAGEYVVREVVPEGCRQTAPLYGESFYAYAYIPNSGGLMQPALIDPTTGDVQRLGTPDLGNRLHGLIRTNDGEFFGLNRSGSYSARLFSLDINTNVKTEVGVVNGDVACGLAYDPAGDTIYALAREPGGGALKLATVDRSNGQLTFLGSGTDQMTGTSGLAWDPDRGVVVGFDNGDDQFWQFDTAGNAELIWETSGLHGWGFSHNGTNFSLLWQVGEGSDTFWEIDPYAQTAELGLQASEPIPMESLDYYRVHGGHLVYVGEGEIVTGLDFANGEVVNALMGTKFNDVDGNGVQDPGEQGTEGVVVYLDQNNNGELDPGEQSTTTGASGDYVFNNLPVGEYVVREVVPEGYLPTAPLYSESFYAYAYVPSSGGQMQPARIDPATGEVLRLGTPATGDRLHGLVRTNDGEFYGMNGFGSAPDRLYSLDINTNVKTEIAPINHNVAWGMAYDPESDTIYVLGRDPLDNALKLASVDRATGELTFFGDGTHAMTGTSGLAWDPVREVVIGFDNSDDQFWQFDRAGNAELLWDTSGLNGWGFSYNGNDFSLLSQVGEGSDTFWEIDPYAQTAELGLQASEPIPMEALDYYRVDGGHLAYIGEGDVVTGLNFGNFKLANALVGTKYQDVDGDGVRDAGEPGVPGMIVYLDQNNNGAMDPGEQSTTTDEQGEYLFNGLPVGEYVVREVIPEGFRQTEPVYGESFYAYAYSPIGGGHMQPTRIDPATGDVQWLGAPVTGDRLHGLVRTNDGEFFGLNGWGQFTDRFFSLDINTNVKTELGDINGDVAWGLAYDPASDTIYALAQESSGGPLKLATVDRSNGQLTFIGSGTSQMTATGGLAWDPDRSVLIGFDNGDDQFWEFDTEGNATLLWDTSGLDGWGLAHNGSNLVLHARRVDGNDRLWDIDPYAQTAVLGLQASEAIPMESLDYYRVDGGHLAYVSEGEVVSGLDFGNLEIVNALIGTKFDDADGDGIQDLGEQGTEGVVVYLDQNNNGELDPGEQSTTTDANGEYMFNALAVGEYVVREVLPDGYLQTTPQYSESYYAYLYVPNSGGYMQPGRIDPQTGEVVRLGTPTRDRIHGLVRTNDGEFFGLNGSGSAPDWFFSLDINTNEHTQIARINGNAKCGLAYDAATDTIYGLGRESSADNTMLAIVDRTTGQYTYIGTRTAEATSISGLAWDPDRGVLIGFDNADDQFWEFDTEGNATLLWDTSGLDGWGLAHNGSNLVLHARRVDGNDRLWDIDPYAQTAVLGLQASEAIPMEALDYFRVDGGHLVYVAEGSVNAGLDFGNIRADSAISGTKFEDLNGDGTQDPGEPGMAGVTVYIDANNNGVLDSGERSTTTDEDGDYVFDALPAGDYVVREIVPDNYAQTAPLDSASFYAYMEATTTGMMQIGLIDPESGQVRRLGTPDSGPALHGMVRTNDGKFFGLNDGGSFTDRFYALNINTNAKTEIGLMNGDVAQGLAYDPASDTIYALARETASGPMRLATVDRTNGNLTYIGPGTSQLNATTALAWHPTEGTVVAYDNQWDQFWEFDTDGNATMLYQTGGLDGRAMAFNGNEFSLYTTYFFGDRRFWNIDPYAHRRTFGLMMSEAVPMESLDYFRVEGGHLVYVGHDETATGVDFGNRKLASVTGTKFEDFNENGLQDPGEPGMEGVTIYVDQNNNGVLDPGELSATTDESGQYVLEGLEGGDHVIREVVPDGYRQTTPLISEAFYAYLYVPNTGGRMQPGRIDPQTGEVLRLGTPSEAYPPTDRLHGLVRTNDGEFFGLNGFGPFMDHFFSLNIDTNEVTDIGLINVDVTWGLAYDSATDTIYSLARETDGGNVRLATVDRTTGQHTCIGTGTPDMTGTSGLAWDPVRNVLIGFDNNDDQFWEFDTAGNATLLWDTDGLNGWGFSYNGTNFSLLNQIGDTSDTFWEVDPYGQTAVLGLQASEPIPMEALDYYRVEGGHLLYVPGFEVVTGVDFGNKWINLPPIADAGGPYVVDEGGTVTLDATGSTDPEGGPLEYLWDLDGDDVYGEVGADAERGDEIGPTPEFSAVGLDGPSSVVVGLKVVDNEDAFDMTTATIEVLNVAPEITEIASNATFDDLGAEDAAVTVTALFVDAGIPDTHTATIDWGDGSPSEPATVTEDGGSGTVSASHAYANGGVFTVTLTVTDDDTGEAVATTQTVVVGAGINNGVLHIVGDDDDNCALVTKLCGHIIVGSDFFPDSLLRLYDASAVDAIQIWLGDGDDHAVITGNVRIPYTMFGGDGDDFLKGGGGRGILIGGLGADRLTGGREDDILIGGTTDYDSNDVALLALLAEWNSDRSYEDRVANISNGTGPILDDLSFHLDGDTVHDDADLDRLIGGRGDDWFFGADDEIRGHRCGR
jgi:hypothetical protein